MENDNGPSEKLGTSLAVSHVSQMDEGDEAEVVEDGEVEIEVDNDLADVDFVPQLDVEDERGEDEGLSDTDDGTNESESASKKSKRKRTRKVNNFVYTFPKAILTSHSERGSF